MTLYLTCKLEIHQVVDTRHYIVLSLTLTSLSLTSRLSVVKVEFGKLGLFLTLGNITPRLRVVERCDDVVIPDVVDDEVDEDIIVMGVVDEALLDTDACSDDDVGSGVIVVNGDGLTDASPSLIATYLLINIDK